MVGCHLRRITRALAPQAVFVNRPNTAHQTRFKLIVTWEDSLGLITSHLSGFYLVK